MCCRVSFSAADRYSPRATSSNAGAAALAQAHDRADACDGAESAGKARIQPHNRGRHVTFLPKSTKRAVESTWNGSQHGPFPHAHGELRATHANGASTAPAIGPAPRQTD